MKIIELTQGLVALVDDDDFERLNKFKWWAFRSKHTFYAVRQVSTGLKRKTIRMHQAVLSGVRLVDHINRFGLDNRKQNLRSATPAQNNQNSRKHSNNTSGFRGVSWFRRDKKWQARISPSPGKQLFLGLYDTKELAAKVYDTAAKRYYGEFAQLNFL